MITVVTDKLPDNMGTSVAFANNETEKTLHLICPVGEDLQEFIEKNRPIAEDETK